jgi:hypothetical protein
VPETNTNPAARTAWLYVVDDGALGVRMISLAIRSSITLERGTQRNLHETNVQGTCPVTRLLRHLSRIVINSDVMSLSDQKWQDLFTELVNKRIPDEEIGSAIVHLAKPFDAVRVETAKDTILGYLDHPHAYARHEAMWFIRWAKLVNHKTALIHALQADPDSDNRGFAALCLAQLLRGTSDHGATQALKGKVLDTAEEELVRLDSYGALLEIAENRSGSDFFSGAANIQSVDWKWVGALS